MLALVPLLLLPLVTTAEVSPPAQNFLPQPALPPPLNDLPYVVDEAGDAMTGPLDMRANLLIEPGSDLLCAACVDTADVRDAAIAAAKLGPGAVTTAKLADGAVTTAKLADASVAAAKLAPGAVLGAALADGAVSAPKLAPGAVGTAALADGSVTAAKLAPGVMKVTDLGGRFTGATAVTTGIFFPIGTSSSFNTPGTVSGANLVMRRAGTLSGFGVLVESNGLLAGETADILVQRNGADTPLHVTLTSATPPGAVLESAGTASVAFEDQVTVKATANTSNGSGRNLAFSWAFTLTSP